MNIINWLLSFISLQESSPCGVKTAINGRPHSGVAAQRRQAMKNRRRKAAKRSMRKA